MNQILYLEPPLNKVFWNTLPMCFLGQPFLKPFLKLSRPFQLEAGTTQPGALLFSPWKVARLLQGKNAPLHNMIVWTPKNSSKYCV